MRKGAKNTAKTELLTPRESHKKTKNTMSFGVDLGEVLISDLVYI